MKWLIFKKVTWNMEIKEGIKEAKIKEHEIISDEILRNKTFDDFSFDKLMEEKNLLSRIDLMENEKLHKAVKKLSIEEQKFISYIFKEYKLQREFADMYRVRQKSISYKYRNILRIIKFNFLDKARA